MGPPPRNATAPSLSARPPDRDILTFSDREGRSPHPWTLQDACQGTQIFGATGSGKTSGSGRHLAIHMLRAGFGGLVLVAKPDEKTLWEGYADETGRRQDLIIVEPGGQYGFNFLDFEYRAGRGSGLTHNLVSVFLAALESGQDRESTADPYWEDALRQLLTNAIDLAAMANQSVHLPDITQIVRTAPQSLEEARSAAWQDRSDCWKSLERAHATVKEPERRKDLAETVHYWLLDFAGLAERTRSVVLNSFTSKATSLLRSPLRELFCSDGPKPVTPIDSHNGRIILLNLPLKEYGEAGRFSQIIFKTVWQRATERRKAEPTTTPVFLWADESQYFVTSHDMLFQQTARSTLAATVYLTQNISNYYAALGGRRGHAVTDSLLGNLQTKIFHANGDPATNEWAERLFARKVLPLRGKTLGDSGYSSSTHDSLQPVVPALEFTSLRQGGQQNGYFVDAIVFQGGRTWNGEHFLAAKFEQAMSGERRLT